MNDIDLHNKLSTQNHHNPFHLCRQFNRHNGNAYFALTVTCEQKFETDG